MNTAPATQSPSYLTRLVALTEHLAPSWFTIVMGWCGLSLAWLNATDELGDWALGLGLIGSAIALCIFLLLCVTCVVRLQAHPQAVAADMKHPIRHAFMGTLPLSLMLLAGIGVSLFWSTSRLMDTVLTFTWMVGSVLEVAATVWVVGRWFNASDKGGLQWATFTPVLFIPVIGNVLAPLAGLTIGLENWATAQFSMGLLLWPVLQTMLMIRLAQAGPLPERLSASIFITMVPPSIIGLCFFEFNTPISWMWGSWGIAVFFLVLSLSKIKTILEQPFDLPQWAVSFPMAAFTTLTFRLSQEYAGEWLLIPAIFLLAATSLIVLGLTFRTVRALRQGQLLAPENK